MNGLAGCVIGALVAASAAGGLLLVAMGARSRPTAPSDDRESGVASPVPTATRHRAGLIGRIAEPRDALVAVIAGGGAFLVTHWPMAAPLGAVGVLALRGLSSAGQRDSVALLESVASWTEMLRDALSGAAGLTQAIVATADTAPLGLRGPVQALAGGLEAGVPMNTALVAFADAVGDPAGDIIVASLLMANRERAQRVGDLLGALAGSIREEVAMRLGVDASRASARTAVRMITGFSLGLFGLMSVFARSYLEPYGTAGGQLMLAVVGLVFGGGLWLMSVMVKPRPFPRLQLAREQG